MGMGGGAVYSFDERRFGEAGRGLCLRMTLRESRDPPAKVLILTLLHEGERVKQTTIYFARRDFLDRLGAPQLADFLGSDLGKAYTDEENRRLWNLVATHNTIIDESVPYSRPSLRIESSRPW
jgi:hypothetical protein